MKDDAKLCLLEEQRPNQDEGPLSRQIRSLESRLDKAMIQYNEAHGICSTYEHIVKRLEEEKLSFDNQLTALERTLELKHQDHEELLLLSTNASHAREIAQQNLQKAKLSLEDGKSRRSRELRERQQHVRLRKQMVKTHERSAEERRKVLCTADTDASHLMTSPTPVSGRKSEVQIADQEHALNMYEAALRKIKDATGVSNVDDVIRKVVGQASTTDNLNSLTAQNQSKLEELKRFHEFLAQEVEKLKHSCVPGLSKNAKTIDEQHELLYLRCVSWDPISFHHTIQPNETPVLVRRASLSERTKSRLDCIAFLIVSIKAGVEHLRDKFTSLHGGEFDLGHEALTEDQLPDVIRSSGDLLVDVLTKTEDSELQNIEDSTTKELPRSASHKNLINRRPMSQGATVVRPFNQRISLPSAKEVTTFDHDSDVELGVGEFDAEESISRDGVKKASSNIIAMEGRRTLRPRAENGTSPRI